jgi:hypothetical protein
MRRHPRDGQERDQRFLAYFADARASDEEKGALMLVLVAHAGVYLVLATAQAAWIAVTAVRVWQRRGDGLRGAMRTGVHKPTLVALAAADIGYVALRRAMLAELDRRVVVKP